MPLLRRRLLLEKPHFALVAILAVQTILLESAASPPGIILAAAPAASAAPGLLSVSAGATTPSSHAASSQILPPRVPLVASGGGERFVEVEHSAGIRPLESAGFVDTGAKQGSERLVSIHASGAIMPSASMQQAEKPSLVRREARAKTSSSGQVASKGQGTAPIMQPGASQAAVSKSQSSEAIMPQMLQIAIHETGSQQAAMPAPLPPSHATERTPAALLSAATQQAKDARPAGAAKPFDWGAMPWAAMGPHMDSQHPLVAPQKHETLEQIDAAAAHIMSSNVGKTAWPTLAEEEDQLKAELPDKAAAPATPTSIPAIASPPAAGVAKTASVASSRERAATHSAIDKPPEHKKNHPSVSETLEAAQQPHSVNHPVPPSSADASSAATHPHTNQSATTANQTAASEGPAGEHALSFGRHHEKVSDLENLLNDPHPPKSSAASTPQVEENHLAIHKENQKYTQRMALLMLTLGSLVPIVSLVVGVNVYSQKLMPA